MSVETNQDTPPVVEKSKFEEFELLAQESGDERMIELAAIAKEYILGLNHIFDKRDVWKLVLEEFDFPMFLKEMSEKGLFNKHQNMQGKLFIMNVLYIARHLWEHTGKDGKLKTGDDLRREWPLMFENDVRRTPLEVFNDLKKR